MEGELGRPETDEAQVVESHRLIVEALRARDPDRAAEVIDLHFADVRARIDHLGRPGKPAMTAPESP
ncbi:MAG: Transcriptional regulator, GntR family [Actinomycetia bacterium]|nr:Transcriptional regulator, GntR family [Actinomycetes bacterium]